MLLDEAARGRHFRWILGIAVLVGVAGFGWTWLSPGPDAKPAELAIVSRQAVEPMSEEISIGNEVKGVLTRLAVQEGDVVTVGKIVAESSNADAAADVKIAEAQLALRQAELMKLMNGARPEERLTAAANLREADAVVTSSKRTLDRKLPLAARGVISSEELDGVQSAYSAAEARRDSLAQQLNLVNAGPRTEDVSIAQANVKLAEATLRRASALFEKTIIRAPIDGTVLRVLRRLGEPVAEFPPTIIMRIGDISRLRVRAEVDETNVGRVKLGQLAFVTADAFGERCFSGHVVKIANTMGRKTLQSDNPAERVDTKVFDTLIDLEPGTILPIGMRVDAFIAPPSEPGISAPAATDRSCLGGG